MIDVGYNKVYLQLTARCFEGYGNGDIMNHPERLAAELVRFLENSSVCG